MDILTLNKPALPSSSKKCLMYGPGSPPRALKHSDVSSTRHGACACAKEGMGKKRSSVGRKAGWGGGWKGLPALYLTLAESSQWQ